MESAPNVDTGFAIAPSETFPSSPLLFTLYDADGIAVQQTHYNFDAHAALFFTQLFDIGSSGFMGSITVESNRDIHLAVLRLEHIPGGFLLTSVPPDEDVP